MGLEPAPISDRSIAENVGVSIGDELSSVLADTGPALGDMDVSTYKPAMAVLWEQSTNAYDRWPVELEGEGNKNTTVGLKNRKSLVRRGITKATVV